MHGGLARKLEHQSLSSGGVSDAGSVSVLSHESSRHLSPPPAPRPWWTKWLGIDAFLQLANTYYASRMVLVTVTSCLSMVLLCMFSVNSPSFVIWILFQLTNTMLGISALPHFQLYSVAPKESGDGDDDDDDDDGESNAQGNKRNTTDRSSLPARRTSFSFLRSSFYAIETKLEKFVLKRSAILRLCESIVVVQSIMLYSVVLLSILIVWATHEKFWDTSLLSTASGLALLAVVCVFIQTKEFDRLRAHEQLQLGVGLDIDQLDQTHSTTRRLGSSGRISAVFMPEDSQRVLRSFRSEIEHSIPEDVALELGHSARLVEHELRAGLYEAAVNRDQHKARALFDVMESVLGSKIKVELFLLKMYSTPTMWLWSFAFTTHNPLHVACRLGDAAMAEVLLHGGINPNQLDLTQGAPVSLRLLYEFCQGRPKNITNVLGAPLHVAVAHGHSHLIDLLVRYGANLDVIAQTSVYSKSKSVSPVFLADSVEVLECLIGHRANFLIVPGKGNSMSVTVLQRVMLNGRSDLESVLKEWGSDVALTPLHEAAAAGDLATIQHYLSLGIPPDQLGEFQDGVHKRTPLHWASVMGRHRVVAELLKHNANVNALDSHGRTPLHWAARHNHVDTILELLLARADPSIQDDHGLTPLAFSAAGGLLDGKCVEHFMEHGIDINGRMGNRSGDTCLHLALRLGHQETALALIKHGLADLNASNTEGLCAVECCASFALLYAVKMCSQWIDIVVSYDPLYHRLAECVKQGIEDNFLTVFMRDKFADSAHESTCIMQEASAVVCILSPGFEHNAICMEELAFAKTNAVPVVALTTDSMTPSDELQFYTYTRQLVPLRDAIILPPSRRRSSAAPTSFSGSGSSPASGASSGLAGSAPTKHAAEFEFTLDDAKFMRSLQSLIDGLRNAVEEHRHRGMRPDGNTRSISGSRSMLMSLAVAPDGARVSLSTSEGTSFPPSERGGSALLNLSVNLSQPSSPTPRRPSSAAGTSSSRGSRGGATSSHRRRSLHDVVKEVLGARRVRPAPLSLQPYTVDPMTTTSVFLSHGDCHPAFISQLDDELRRHGLNVTVDSMAHLSSMKERILAAKNAIDLCDIFVVVLSEKSVKTELVSDQLAFAEDKGKHIVPIHFSRKPSLVNKELGELLDAMGQQLLVVSEDLSYGRGFDELLAKLEKEKSILASLGDEDDDDDDQPAEEDDDEEEEYVSKLNDERLSGPPLPLSVIRTAKRLAQKSKSHKNKQIFV